jgi:phage shock protein PspC (stress-responsive transcriptional regulator)
MFEGKKIIAVTARPKKLYQMPDEGLITGVVRGLSVYFNIDVKILRYAFMVLFAITKGAWALVYIAMMVTVPVAKSAGDFARAKGEYFVVSERRSALRG